MVRRPAFPRALPRALAFALAAAFTGLLATGPAMTASAQTPSVTTDGTLLSVSADASASRVPDIATLSTGVVTQSADANSALRANAEQMNKVMTAVKAAGIAERDIQTSGISIQPQYRYAENQPPAITGYQASNTVNLKVRDIGKLGKVLDALVASGANQVNGAGPRRHVRENPGPARAPHHQHQRWRRLPAAASDADDEDGDGRSDGQPGVAGRDLALGHGQRGVRTRQVSLPSHAAPTTPAARRVSSFSTSSFEA
jgi:hypothetical protein